MPIRLYFGNEEILAAVNGGGTPATTTTTTTSTTTTTTTIAYVTSGLVVNLDNAPQVGAVWNDSSGNGNNFDIVGSPARTTDYGGGIIIATTSQIMYNSSFNNTSAFTVEMVAITNPTSFWGVMWGNESWTAQNGFFAYWGGTNNLRFNRPQQDPGLNVTTTQNQLAQFVFTYNGTSIIYRNGSSIASSVISAPGAANSGFTIACRHGNNGVIPTPPVGDHCPGTYYLMRVYNRALTAGEVTQNYNAISARFGI